MANLLCRLANIASVYRFQNSRFSLCALVPFPIGRFFCSRMLKGVVSLLRVGYGFKPYPTWLGATIQCEGR